MLAIIGDVLSANRQEARRPAPGPAPAAPEGGDQQGGMRGDGALRALFDVASAGMTELDIASARYLRVNRRFCEMTGRSEAELLTLGPADVLHPDDRRDVGARWRAATSGSGHWDAEIRYLRPDGSVVWARISVGVSARDGQGRPTRCVGIAQDITDSRAAAERLAASEALLRLGQQIGHMGDFRHDFATDLVSAGPQTRAIYGLPAGDAPIRAEDWFAPILPEDRQRMRAEFARTVAARQTEGAIEYRIHRPPGGELRHLEARVRFEYAEGKPVGALGVVIDITERRQADARIAYMAQHDELTGLPNRVLFRHRLEEALARAGRGEIFAVLFLDLDRFKTVNDTLGHPVGDALLRAVTERLADPTRRTDTVARLGGDEFAIIQTALDHPTDASTLAKRLIELLGEPFELGGHSISIGASVGIAMVPGDGADADTLLKHADLALYRAKADGRGTWRFFEPQMDAMMQARRTLELDLRLALAAGQFEVFYQPIMAMRTRTVSGFEALIRWRHPTRGLVPPDAFIPLAEEIGLIVPIGAWVLRRACADAQGWPAPLKVSVNLSPVQFAGAGPVPVVQEALAASGLDPTRLELEITEKVMLDDTEATLLTLRRLKAIGVSIAMDDFGTGYSSLSYLRKFPFDRVKIDKSFIADPGQSAESAAIVEAVTNLCQTLGMVTTVEGVETEAQLRWLTAGSCTNVQGYLFSRPRPAGDVAELCRALGPGVGATEGRPLNT